MLKNRGFTIGFICWMGFITLLSLGSFSAPEGLEIEIPYLDKAVHFTFYFIASLLGCLWLWERRRSFWKRRKAQFTIVLGLSIYGILIEVIQEVMHTGRSGEYADGLANVLGALCGALLSGMLISASGHLKW